ncbi:coiled-coil domain-containing protein 183 [Osmia bicornis bicornis]|uniref:coiled-coil domain-containing protein 183 n=1 Tax=Osmia bicornis bicornis TaxID=1437191 RepID=UPI0010F6F1AF|nr:coiled-coil domain-containing protein 183 [Osmia bicornis bicornis]
MFTVKQTQIFRGFKDERWSTKDKLEQYRGILKLHVRERKQRLQDSVKLKKRISWQLGSYKEDVNKYRQLTNRLTNGIPESYISNLLQDRKDLRLKCHGRKTEQICVLVYEGNHRKRCQLDKLRYQKKRKLKQCFQLQLEHAQLCAEYAQEEETPWAENRLQQRLVTSYQRSVAKENAAKAINVTYVAMLDILKQDAINHERLLNALKQDRENQCKAILKATIMGQLATEETDDIATKCKRIARIVWNNMKERERMLAIVRDRVEDLWSFARSLIRTESETIFTMEITRGQTASNVTLEKQITTLEEIFDKVKESLLVRSYRELLSRLEEQMKQRTQLLEQFNRNVKERDLLLRKKNEALSALSNFEHSLVATTEEYNTDKNVLLEQISIQKKRREEHENLRKEHGELLMDIRAALQNMLAMLFCVRRGSKVPKKQTDELDEQIVVIEKMETEGLTLLSTVSRKVGALFGMSNFEFNKDREQRAKDLYQTYVSDYHSKLKFEDAGFEPTGLFVEHETIDSSVPTRAEIKLRSRQIVETYLRLE